jgi:hypothetical protein
MKSLIHLTFTCLAFSTIYMSCFSPISMRNTRNIQTYQDEFRGSKKIILEQTLYPTERTYLSNINALSIIFEKEMMPSQTEQNTIYLVFSRGTGSFTIDKKGFMKIGDTTFPLDAKSMQTEYKTQVSTSVDTAGMTSTETSHWLNDYFKMPLTTEMVALMRRNQGLTLRFYAGPIPLTFIIKGSNAEKLREWVSKT